MPSALFLILPLIGTVAFLIRAELLNHKRQVYILKPLSTLLVILTAAGSLCRPDTDYIYFMGIMIGLIFSLAGDAALMFHGRKPFILGLFAFLFAHISYTIVFWLRGRFSFIDLWIGVALAISGILIYRHIRKGLGQLKIPVIAYIVIISLMVSRAVSTWAHPACLSLQAAMISSGALLFYSSDAVLAINRFAKPIKHERFGLALYYAGQFLIALSTHPFK